MTASAPGTNPPPRSSASAIGWLLLGSLSLVLFAQAVLEDLRIAGAFVSQPVWTGLVQALGGRPSLGDVSGNMATLPLTGLAVSVFLGAGASWLAGGWVISALGGRTWRFSLIEWGRRGWKWWCLPGVWFVLAFVGLLIPSDTLTALMGASAELWWALALAGWLATLLALGRPAAGDLGRGRIPGWVPVSIAMGLYVVVFTWMNWRLYEGLLVPHGDSAMYEEHLWNITHGKGFRSYLDQGLFLGEHIQVIHLALLPVYLVWPSHLLLELCESAALALTALPIYWIARRHTGSERAAVWMGVAALLYFPLQYLDIAIDLKTFRPISFGVPLLLLAIDQMERRRWKTMAALLVATLTAKEDFAIVIAPLGVWLCMTGWLSSRRTSRDDRDSDSRPAATRVDVVVGAVMAVAATVYLLLAVKLVIPWFRTGETVHYARYFGRFGETPTEIVVNMLTQPGRLLGEFLTAGTILYGLRVLVPLGGTPVLSPSRLLVGAPLFLLLCLNELAQVTPAPVHHFHAPLLPILFWSAAAGLANVPGILERFQSRITPGGRVSSEADGPAGATSGPSLRSRPGHPDDFGQSLNVARFACLCALTSGMVLSIHPLSRKFWDPGHAMHWQRLYVPGERAERFAEILLLIPQSARVASTDFVHPRFTHHERSYDYSGYLRKVAGYERRVPDDTDFIVIDTQHPYSTLHVPEDVPEFHQPDEWDLLTTEPNPWFIVLKRRSVTDE